MTAGDADPLLRRLERRALVFCVLAAGIALWARGGRADVALGVVGGGVLIGVSYWAIRSSIDGILALALPASAKATAGRPDREAQDGIPVPPTPDGSEGAADGEAGGQQGGGQRRGRALVYGFRFVGRYVVLGLLAYVMLVWLRLHPLGLILGVSSIAVAAAVEAASAFSRRDP